MKRKSRHWHEVAQPIDGAPDRKALERAATRTRGWRWRYSVTWRCTSRDGSQRLQRGGTKFEGSVLLSKGQHAPKGRCDSRSVAVEIDAGSAVEATLCSMTRRWRARRFDNYTATRGMAELSDLVMATRVDSGD
ncbi:hypothetical protein M6B38_321525 [Iris pallida]|uniref:Uncharacterized protein n=1 Tax=Iris pallida TaxID=29817 RepID=A0AAX6HCF9_IRIPA|nr:hypothetical protein M6B38_321525 [Iris pallida]